jgi:polyisoprenoid-binding protein YceI
LPNVCRARNLLKSHVLVNSKPSVGPVTDRSPCRARSPLSCNVGMEAKRDHATVTPRLGRYVVDTDNSAVTFATRHLFGLAPVRGTFAIRAGTVDICEPLAGSAIRVEIDAASFRTGNSQRDVAVRSARFLDVARHPVIAFAATEVKVDDAPGVAGPGSPARVGPITGAGTVLSGTLTVGDITRPIRVPVEGSSISATAFTVRATARVDRTDFGLTAARGLAGRHLDISAEVVCVHV